MRNNHFLSKATSGRNCGFRALRGAAARLATAILYAVISLCSVAPSMAAEIDYQSLQENPVDTIFRRILTQEVPGWSDSTGFGLNFDPDMNTIVWPLKEGRIAGLFNLRASKGKRRHKGIDLLAPRGTSIYAALDGIVEVVSSGGKGWRGYGKVVFINHDGKFWTLYSHCDMINVKIGQRVKQGEQIATVGRTGRATGFHVHFELRDTNGSPIDPMRFLPRKDALPAVKR